MEPTPHSPDARGPLQAAWPRATQLATAFLLGAAGMLLAVQIWHALPGGTRPSDLRSYSPIDLNRATRAELMQLPGVGPALAERIESHRHNHGPFRSVEALRDVPGIGPVTLERLRPALVVTGDDEESAFQRLIPQTKETPADPIDIGWASAEELQRLPGIGPVLSRRIVEERQKTPFRSVEDLRRVPGIGPKTLQKLRPLVCVREEA